MGDASAALGIRPWSVSLVHLLYLAVLRTRTLVHCDAIHLCLVCKCFGIASKVSVVCWLYPLNSQIFLFLFSRLVWVGNGYFGKVEQFQIPCHNRAGCSNVFAPGLYHWNRCRWCCEKLNLEEGSMKHRSTHGDSLFAHTLPCTVGFPFRMIPVPVFWGWDWLLGHSASAADMSCSCVLHQRDFASFTNSLLTKYQALPLCYCPHNWSDKRYRRSV